MDSANSSEELTYPIKKQMPYFFVASVVFVVFFDLFDLVLFARFVFFAVGIAFLFYASF